MLKEEMISFAVAAHAAVNAASALAMERKQKLAILNRQMSTAAGRAHLVRAHLLLSALLVHSEVGTRLMCAWQMTSLSCATASACVLVSSGVFYFASVDRGWEVLLAMSLVVFYLCCSLDWESLDVC